jgi:LuxR family maltose regulon positive regulatory protein
MSTPTIVATKLFVPPPRPRVVPRPRLIKQLNDGLYGKLTLVSAPAGFGKTTLVSEWLAGCGRPAAWLSLDEGDSDPPRFLLYLVAALRTILPELGDGVVAALHSPQPPPAEALLTALINEMIAVPGDFILVLDDYHVLEATPVDQLLTFLLEHLPPQMHVAITTREDPQLPLARLRARGQMTELRAVDLRFDPAEAAGFLTQVMGLDLSDEEVAALERRTEGWIAGLQLAALSMRGRADVAQFVKAFAGDNRFIVDYLVEEVLQRQPDRVRSFLLQTSILARLSGSLCDAVTGQHDGVALLDALERSNLFVVPLDDSRYWFRYHHLFADVLAAHALQEQPAQMPIWHRRASAWYADNGMPAEAIRHALAARDYVRAAGLVEQAWPAMDGRFQSATWLGWAKALPNELVRTRPVLSVAYAWAFLNGGELEAAAERLQDAERWLDTSDGRQARPQALASGIAEEITEEIAEGMVVVDQEQFRTLPASIATARAYHAQARGDIPDSVKYGQRALDLLPEGDHLRRGPAAALLGLAQWGGGDLEAAYRTLADAMAGFQQAGSLHFALSVTSGLVEIRTVQGRLREAVKANTQALQLALAQGTPPLRGTANLYLGLSELYHELGKQDTATQYLLYSEELGEQAALPDWRYRLCRVRARFKVTHGDLAGALDLLDEAERHHRRTPVPDVRPLAALKTRVWVAQGRLTEALHWAHEQGLSADVEPSYLREFELITLARLLVAEYVHNGASGAMREAMQLLERLRQAAEAGGRMGSVIEIGVVQVLAHQAQNDPAHALVALERALRLAEPERPIRIFVDEGAPVARLLSAVAAQGILPAYCGTLLAAFATGAVEALPPADKASPHRVFSDQTSVETLVEPLSARELEVLQLIAQGLSNQAIGSQLFLALSTVKGHNRNIFAKLQVQSRTEAIARARELGLL